MLLNERERVERLCELFKLRRCDAASLVVVDRHAQDAFLVAIALDHSSQLGVGPTFEQRLSCFGKTLCQRRNPALELVPQAALFHRDLVERERRRQPNQGTKQRSEESKTTHLETDDLKLCK